MYVLGGGDMGCFFNVFTCPIYISLNIDIGQILMFYATLMSTNYILLFLLGVLIVLVLGVTFRMGV